MKNKFLCFLFCAFAVVGLSSVTAFAGYDDEVVGNKYTVAMATPVTCDAYADGTIVTHPIPINPSSLTYGDEDDSVEMYVSKVLVIPKNGWSITTGLANSAKKFSISVGEQAAMVEMAPTGEYCASFEKSSSPIVNGGIPVSVGLSFAANSGEGAFSDIAEVIVLLTADMVVVAPPAQTGVLTYNGSDQSPSWTDSSKVEMSGVTHATDVGTYTAVATPKFGYCWSDGTTTGRGVTWTIGKAAGSVTAPTAKTLTYTGSAQNLVNAGSSTTGTIQYKLSGGTYGTSIPQATNAGTYTVYYKVVGDSNHNDVAERSVSVTIGRPIAITAPVGSVVTMGTFLRGGTTLAPANVPCASDYSIGGVAGNLPAYSTSSTYAFGNTNHQNSAVNLKWIKVSNTLFICDRNLLHSISWNDINSMGYVTGSKTVTIDGETYKIRLLTKDEWMAAIGASANSGTYGQDSVSHWNNCYSWTSTSAGSGYYYKCGYSSASYTYNYNATYRLNFIGFRPALELVS